MSEVSTKTPSTKKRFTAPILKGVDAASGKPNEKDVSLKKAKVHKKENENSSEPSGIVSGKKMTKESKKKDKNCSEPNGIEDRKKMPKESKKKDQNSSEPKGIVGGKKIPKESKNKDQNRSEPKGIVSGKKIPKESKMKDENSSELNGTVSRKKMPEESKKKPIVSLTDSQYDEIFSAVLTNSASKPNSEHNTPIDEVQDVSEKSVNKTPARESLGILKRPGDAVEPQTPVKTPKLDAKSTPTPSRSVPSPWGSVSKYSSQASSLLKELEESQQLLMTSMNESSSDSDSVVESSQLSVQQSSQVSAFSAQSVQPPHTVLTGDQRSRLEQLQLLRNVGVWVHCCRMSCNKLRYLANITDPQDVPDIWYCHMNPDPKYNDCLCEQQEMSPEDQADLIANEHTAGSLVWAKVAGFPWWPAMVDDDPDLEQYYWLANDFETVTFYHVVFFDEAAVTRAWVDVKHITAYKRFHGNRFAQQARGIDFRHRISVAKEQADDAFGLSTPERLRIYSFIARYKGPISTSINKVKETMKKYKLKEPADTDTVKDKKTTNKTKKDKITVKVSSDKLKKTRKSHSKKTENGEKHKKVKKDKKIIPVGIASRNDPVENLGSKKENDPNLIDTKGDSDETNILGSENLVHGNGERGVGSEETGEKINVPEERQSVTLERMTESSSDFVEPSQVLVDNVRQEESSRLSQSTITDFLAKGSEDAVVPELCLSQDFSQESEE
ncbi:zinc finger CW-type PWWP domain protein 1-like isoform X2 [Homalodisca vitripennis]|uniref:zinc finger CW-type PWWP domain protein 1-like isoform X2 n=1 Tax=Homalodisca vitripennis TaxID=197043 RepID=UPI001EEC9015|nr:zinc finger CW-type PWWP domain protein 1-like isoform X2 [Homalodisca vitripennis]